MVSRLAEALGLSTAEALRLVTWSLFLAVVAAHVGLYADNAARADTPWVNHDVAYHTYLGVEMIGGSRLYIDLLEDNPPGNVVLLGTVAAISRLLRLPDFLGQHLLLLLLGAGGLVVLQSAFGKSEEEGRRFLLVGLAFLVVVVRGNFANNLYPAAPDLPYDFGQREHLFSVLFVPYLVLRASGRPPPRQVYPFLVLLGWVATFKPFWAPMIVLVELFRRGAGPRRWDVPVAIATGMAMPFLLLLLHSPASVAAFLTENIPMYLRGGYTHYDTGYAEFAASSLHLRMVGAGAALLGAAVLCAFPARVDRRVPLLFVLTAGIAYASVVQQHKFWSYHTMTFFAVTVVPAASLLSVAVSRWQSAAARNALTATLAAAGLFAAGATVADTSKMLRGFPPLGAELVRLIEPYEKTMFFSMSVTTSYAPLLLRKPMVGPYTVFLDLPELLALDDPSERAAALDDYADDVNRVIADQRPDLLVYSPGRQALPEGRNLHDLLLEMGVDPARHGYLPVSRETLAGIDRRLGGWTVYRRVPG